MRVVEKFDTTAILGQVPRRPNGHFAPRARDVFRHWFEFRNGMKRTRERRALYSYLFVLYLRRIKLFALEPMGNFF